MPFHRSTPPPEPEPQPESAETSELNLHAHNQFQIALVGLNRMLRSAALDALLDDYLAQRGPRPEEETDDPALDHH